MNNKIILLGFIIAINPFSLDAFSSNKDVLSAVKSYAYMDGEPYGLSEVYQIDEPDTGFPPYYFFQKFGKGNAYPFVLIAKGFLVKMSHIVDVFSSQS